MTALQMLYAEQRAAGRDHHQAIRELAWLLDVDGRTVARVLRHADASERTPHQHGTRASEPAGDHEPTPGILLPLDIGVTRACSHPVSTPRIAAANGRLLRRLSACQADGQRA